MVRRGFDRDRFLNALYVLNVPPPVTAASINRAYRQQVKAHHPDRFRSQAEKRAATAMLQEINAARDYVMAYLLDALTFGIHGSWGPNPWPVRWTREACVRACAEYERIWPADPRD